MKKEFAYFEPAGPLRYLLMNNNKDERYFGDCFIEE